MISENYSVNKIISPLKIVIPYLIFGLIYILTSDYILSIITDKNDLYYKIQSVKGVGFILITSILLYFLVKGHSDIIIKNYELLIGNIKRSENEARLSEEKYMNLFNVSPLPMWIFDKDTLKFKLVNNAAVEKYGYSKSEFYSMTLAEIRPEKDLELMHEVLKSYGNETRRILPTTLRHLTKSGQLLFVKVERVSVLFDNKESILVIVSDLTDSIKNEKRLIESYQRLNSASKIAKIGYWSIDFNTKRVYCSKILKEILEVDELPENINWKMLLDRVFEEDTDEVIRQMKKLGQNGINADFEHRVYTLDGNIKWVKHKIKLNRDREGKFIGYEGILVDISERKNAEDAASKNLERYNMLSKTVFEAIVDWDLVNNQVYLSEGFNHLFGYRNTKDITNFWAKNIFTSDKQRVLNNLRKVISDPNQFEFFDEYRFMKSNGELAYVQHKGIFERDKNGKVVRAVGAINDITESVYRIRKINSQNEKLSKVIWTQSHIIRSPLVSIIGLVDVLKLKHDFEKKDIEDILEMLYKSAEKLDMAIHDLTYDLNREVDEENEIVRM